MITPKSDHKIKLRFVKKYGDADMILGFYTTEFWQRLFKKDKLLPWSLLRDYTRFLTALSAFSVGAVFRYRHGSKTTGILLAALTALWLVTLNSALLPFFLKPLVFWISPAFLGLTDQTLSSLISVEIRSYPLYVFALFYMVCALVHVVMIYIGKGNPDANKRGNSWLYLLLFNKTERIPEHMVQMIVEPLLIAGCGSISWLYKDPVFAVFLWSGAFAVFLQEYLDHAWRKKHDSYF